MRAPRTKTLIFVGILIGLFAGVALATITFDPGDAGKVSDGVPFGAPDGMNVTIHGETNVSMDDTFPNSSDPAQWDNRSVNLTTASGNITLASDSPANASVHTSNLTGTWTNVTSIGAGPDGNTWIEIYPEDKQRVDVKGGTDELSIKSVTLDDGTADLYISADDGATGTVKIYDVTANQRIVAVNHSTGAYLDHNTSTASGNVTLSIDLSDETVRLSSLDTTNAPVHSNADPTGGVGSQPSELSVDVNDSDFSVGDEVMVNISLDGSQIHSENITSNSTVTTSNFNDLDLGSHTWTVNSTDLYGNTQSDEFSFELPSNITLRNESNASQIITDQSIEVTFYSTNGEVVIRKNDADGDGNILLEGLPETAFVITFSGSDNWYDRRIFIESIFNQQNIYLLNKTAFPTSDDSAIETTFVYEDRTAQFGQNETTLRIQRAVDPDNDDNFTWQNVAGDFWGAAGEFPFTGEHQERYRLVIKNQETGDKRTLGTHIPVEDGAKNIIVGDIIFDAENATGRFFDAGVNQNTSKLQILYDDPTNGTTDLRIVVHEHGNKSNEIFNQTFAGPLGRQTATVSLTNDQNDTNWVVSYDGTHDDDGEISGQTLVGGARYPLNMDPAILASFGYVAVTFVMALYGPRTALYGAWAGVLVFAGIMFVGWISWSIPALTIAAVAAAGGTFYKESMPN